MVDFAKLRKKAHKAEYTYQCTICGQQETYILKLPEHMLTHTPIVGPCARRRKGRLVLVRKRVVLKLLREQQ